MSSGAVDVRGRNLTPGTTMHRTGSSIRPIKDREGLQTVRTLQQRQAYNGLCFPRPSLQSQKVMFKDTKISLKEG